MPLDYLVRRHGVRRGPVLHVGAHAAEEAEAYHAQGFRPVWWIEANPALIPELERRARRYPGSRVVHAVVADEPRPVTLHLASNGQSSSILPLGTHAFEHPEVTYVGEEVMVATTVDALWDAGQLGQARFLNVDVQGAELDVLRGAERYLEGVQDAYLEVNERELYEGCALLPELQAWMAARGFAMREVSMTRHGWGDALFSRGLPAAMRESDADQPGHHALQPR